MGQLKRNFQVDGCTGCTDVGFSTLVEVSLNEYTTNSHAKVIVDVTDTRPPARFVLFDAMQCLHTYQHGVLYRCNEIKM